MGDVVPFARGWAPAQAVRADQRARGKLVAVDIHLDAPRCYTVTLRRDDGLRPACVGAYPSFDRAYAAAWGHAEHRSLPLFDCTGGAGPGAA
jgi:hypothetical protein